MRKLIIALFLFSSLTVIKAQDLNKKYTAIRVEDAPKIDGILDDEAWAKATPNSDFTQNRPIEGSLPPNKTEIRVVYNNNAIYVAAQMYDEHPETILHELGNRDDGNLNADFFRFVIDPYNTRQDAFDFGVYASGVQVDQKFSDPTYDGVWQSATKINDKGWVVEIKIPYSAIRFPQKSIQEWGLQFTRTIRKTREIDQWALTPSGVGNPLKFWGTLQGVTDIKTPVRLSLTPYFSVYTERRPAYNDDNTYSYGNSLSYSGGADIKYGIDDRFTLDMTLFPDFSQVQSDKKVKNLSYNEVTYDENRSFFKEGTDLFNKFGLFYSRRIGRTPTGYNDVSSQLKSGEVIDNNPQQVRLLNATKVSGRTDGGLGIGLFNAVTDNTYATVKDSAGNKRNVLTEPLTNYNIFVFDQQLANNSSVFVINTNVLRDKKYDDANVTATGFTLNNKANTYAIDAVGALSQKIIKAQDLGSETYQTQLGYRYYLDFKKISGQFQYGISRTVTNNTYDSRDLGYYIINNYINHNAYVKFNVYKANQYFRDSYNTLSYNYSTNYLTNKRTTNSVDLSLYSTLLDYNSVFGGGGFTPLRSLDYNEPRTYDGRFFETYRYYYFYLGISSDYRKRVAIDLTQNLSNFIDKFTYFGYNTDLGIRLRVTNSLSLIYKFSYYFDPFNIGRALDINNNPVADADGHIIFGGRILKTYVNALTASYIFTKDMSISLNGRHYWNTGQYREYFILQDDGQITETNTYPGNNNFSYNVFNIDLVYSWRFAPGSVLSIAYKNAIENSGLFTDSRFANNFKTTVNAPQVNSLSVRLLYYLDYLYLRKNTGKTS